MLSVQLDQPCISRKCLDCSMFSVNRLTERLVSGLHLVCAGLASGCGPQRPSPARLKEKRVGGSTWV